MTFEQAVTLKNSEQSPLNFKGYPHNIVIAPSINDELGQFIQHYDESTYTDEDAKKYSSNNKFRLYLIMTKDTMRKLDIPGFYEG